MEKNSSLQDKTRSLGFWMTREEAFEMGFSGKSIFDNPFRKEYPKGDPLSEEADFARAWVDGYCAQAKKERENAKS